MHNRTRQECRRGSSKYSMETCIVKKSSPSHNDPGIHRTCILRNLNGCISDGCHYGPGMKYSRDQGTQHATRPSQMRRQDYRPRQSRRHDCNSAATKQTSQPASRIANEDKRGKRRKDAPILADHFPFFHEDLLPVEIRTDVRSVCVSGNTTRLV